MFANMITILQGFSFTEERMRQVGLDVTNNDSMSYNSHLYRKLVDRFRSDCLFLVFMMGWLF